MVLLPSEKQLKCFFICSIVIGVLLHIVQLFYQRSLWIDEAMLVSSICTRSFSTLISSPLDWGQSSAIGWLYIVKMFTFFFGVSVTTLRIWSLLSCMITTFLIYLLLNNKVKQKYALFISAIFLFTNMFIYYGNEAKPYMSDNMFCLLTLFIWQKYLDNKFNLWQCCISFSIILWFSFTSVFFIASCMIIEFTKVTIDLFKKRKCKYIHIYFLLSLVLLSFLSNYFIWLSQSVNNAGGGSYWENLKFPILPASFSDIILAMKLIRQLAGFYPIPIALLFLGMNIYYLTKVIKNKKDVSHIASSFTVSLILLLIASYFGYYPIQDRLVQIYSIVCLIIVGYSLDAIAQEIRDNESFLKSTKIISVLFYAILILSFSFICAMGCKRFFPQCSYRKGDEVTQSYNYLKKYLKREDVIYVHADSIPVFIYLNGYKITYNDLISKREKNKFQLNLPQRINNIIYGQNLFSYFYKETFSYEGKNNSKAATEDAELISQNCSVYIFASHGEKGINYLLNLLEQKGKIDTVVNIFETHLYHFKKNKC